jgi:hypothetical protein
MRYQFKKRVGRVIGLALSPLAVAFSGFAPKIAFRLGQHFAEVTDRDNEEQLDLAVRCRNAVAGRTNLRFLETRSPHICTRCKNETSVIFIASGLCAPCMRDQLVADARRELAV